MRYAPVMNDRYIGQLVHGNVEVMVLSVLARGPLHVYGIKKAVYLASSGYFGLSEGRLYPLLRRFERLGYVVGRNALSSTGRLVREYSLTVDGRTELDARITAWRIFSAKLNGIMEQGGDVV